MTEYGTYFYAVGRPLAEDDVTGLAGVAGAPVRVIEHRGLAAAVSTVDLAEFGEEGLRRNLEDLGWLETVARAHDRVVARVGEVATCAPLRLATVCLDDDSVRAKVDDWHSDLEDTLARLAGRVELGVKGYTDAVDVAATAMAAGTEESGTAYLMRRRAETTRRAEAADTAAEVADGVHAKLAGRAVASRRYPPQEQRLSGHEGHMVLNATYLVDRSREQDLRTFAERLVTEHPDLRLEVTGPWSPYSFADVGTK